MQYHLSGKDQIGYQLLRILRGLAYGHQLIQSIPGLAVLLTVSQPHMHRLIPNQNLDSKMDRHLVVLVHLCVLL